MTTQQVATIQNMAVATISIEIRDLVAKLRNDLINEAGRDTLTRLPSPEEREVLKTRYVALNDYIKPANYTKHGPSLGLAGGAIAEMFQGFPTFTPDPTAKTPEERKAAMRKAIAFWVTKLGDFPVFAIQQACKDIILDNVEGRNPDYVPTVPRLAQLCRKHSNGPREEHAVLKRILMVKEVRFDAKAHPEMAEKIRKGFEDLAREISTNDAKAEQARQAELAKISIDRNRQQVLRMYAAEGMEPVYTESGVLVSPTLLKKNLAAVRRSHVRPEHEGEGS